MTQSIKQVTRNRYGVILNKVSLSRKLHLEKVACMQK
jgi:hypothetical protein